MSRGFLIFYHSSLLMGAKKKIASTHGGRFFACYKCLHLSHVALYCCHVIAPRLISLLWMPRKQEVAACRTVPSLPSAVAHVVHIWNLGHSVDALKTNETVCSGGGRSKYNQAKSRPFERPHFHPRNRIAPRYVFRKSSRNLSWCALWKSGKIWAGRKETSRSFQIFFCVIQSQKLSKRVLVVTGGWTCASLIETFPRKLASLEQKYPD